MLCDNDGMAERACALQIITRLVLVRGVSCFVKVPSDVRCASSKLLSARACRAGGRAAREPSC